MHDHAGMIAMLGFTTLATTPLQTVGLLVVLAIAAVLVLVLGAPAILRVVLWLWRFPFRVPFAAVLLVTLLYLYFDASRVYGADAPRMQAFVGGYLIADGFAFGLGTLAARATGAPHTFVNLSLGKAAILLAIGFGVGVTIFGLLANVDPEVAPFHQSNPALLFTHASVVAVSEETIFRFFLPALLRMMGTLDVTTSHVLSNIGFAVLHLAAYTQGLENFTFTSVLGPLVFVGLLGGAFSFIAVKAGERGLVFDMGAHAGWNGVVLGLVALKPTAAALIPLAGGF